MKKISSRTTSAITLQWLDSKHIVFPVKHIATLPPPISMGSKQFLSSRVQNTTPTVDLRSHEWAFGVDKYKDIYI